MKLAARIVQSRQGVYYYRPRVTVAGRRLERRFSLETKDPVVAKEKSLLVSAMLVADKAGIHMSDQKEDSIKNLLNKVGDTARNLEVIYSSPNGQSITLKADPNVAGDVDALLQVGRNFLNSELGKSSKLAGSPPAAPTQPIQPVPVVHHAPAPVPAGMTIEESTTQKKSCWHPRTIP